ncbi:MAG TPA: FAD-dependent oxidoreductase [Kofleriaceae bacterium]|nr:FAD-dependent oxidoreductase [Kofleriaceae bacterium]
MESAKRSLVIVGGGFAGVWAALAAARQRRALRLDDEIAIRVVSPERAHGIRPRFYEADLSPAAVELARIFAPVGIEHVCDRAVGLDLGRREVQLADGRLPFDALVWALGSTLVRPRLPGAERLHSVDTLADAAALDRHLRALAAGPELAGRDTIVVVGAGFTGLEAATELVTRFARLLGRAVRVVLVERSPHVGPEFGPDARAVIEAALAELGVAVRTGATVAELGPDAVALSSGETIATRTVVWSAGVQAHPAARWLGPPADAAGRLAVDAQLQVTGQRAIFAAGDVARALVDGEQPAMMSCQHAIPQGRYAGHNALRLLAGRSLKRYEQRLYLTCLDLGAWGGLLTCGFDRNRILAIRDDAARLKRFINTTAIYPPLDADPAALLRAAAPPPGGRLASAVVRWAVSSPRVRRVIAARATTPASAAPATALIAG